MNRLLPVISLRNVPSLPWLYPFDQSDEESQLSTETQKPCEDSGIAFILLHMGVAVCFYAASEHAAVGPIAKKVAGFQVMKIAFLPVEEANVSAKSVTTSGQTMLEYSKATLAIQNPHETRGL